MLLTGFASFPMCFNTQPPEGGWWLGGLVSNPATGFQHTAARRRLAHDIDDLQCIFRVSTHSRPKAAGCLLCCLCELP